VHAALLPDVALVARAQDGDERALRAVIERYLPLVRRKGRAYFLVGGDRQDVEQEALIGLYEAVRAYSGAVGVPFPAFAELCVTRQVVAAVRGATRRKHLALNSYVSISSRREDDGELAGLEQLLDDHHPDPAERVVAGEGMELMHRAVSGLLTRFEADVLRLHLEGVSYVEIADRLGRPAKSVDNALQRVRRKVGRYVLGRAAGEREPEPEVGFEPTT
jgi:RNA polymerase sporulation-specific sigma factor